MTALATNTEQTTALAKREGGNPFLPTTMEEAIDLATRIAKSELAPKDYRGKPENTLIAMMMGFELGIAPMQAIQNISVINGRAAVWGDLMLALCETHPHFEDIIETDDGTTATCVVKRKGRTPHEVTFSVLDAKVAGLLGKDTWQKFPKRMRQMRARAFALRDRFSDKLKGLYTREEAEDMEPAEVLHVRTADAGPLPTLACGDNVMPDIDDLRARIAAAASLADIDALKPLIMKLSPNEQQQLRTLIDLKRGEQGGQPAKAEPKTEKPKEEKPKAEPKQETKPKAEKKSPITVDDVVAVIDRAETLADLDRAAVAARVLDEKGKAEVRKAYAAKKRALSEPPPEQEPAHNEQGEVTEQAGFDYGPPAMTDDERRQWAGADDAPEPGSRG